MQCEIISVGSELTSGQNLDTNTQWLSQRLAEIGIGVGWHTTLADDLNANVDALLIAARRAKLVLVTGGLGPTQDDLTREALAKVAGRRTRPRPESLAHIERCSRSVAGRCRSATVSRRNFRSCAPIRTTTARFVNIASMCASDSGSRRVRRPRPWQVRSRVRSSCVGPRPPGDEDELRASCGDEQGIDVRVQVVGERRVPADADADLGESLAQPLSVRVEVLTAGQFAPDRDDFALHVVLAVAIRLISSRIMIVNRVGTCLEGTYRVGYDVSEADRRTFMCARECWSVPLGRARRSDYCTATVSSRRTGLGPVRLLVALRRTLPIPLFSH